MVNFSWRWNGYGCFYQTIEWRWSLKISRNHHRLYLSDGKILTTMECSMFLPRYQYCCQWFFNDFFTWMVSHFDHWYRWFIQCFFAIKAIKAINLFLSNVLHCHKISHLFKIISYHCFVRYQLQPVRWEFRKINRFFLGIFPKMGGGAENIEISRSRKFSWEFG